MTWASKFEISFDCYFFLFAFVHIFLLSLDPARVSVSGIRQLLLIPQRGSGYLHSLLWAAFLDIKIWLESFPFLVFPSSSEKWFVCVYHAKKDAFPSFGYKRSRVSACALGINFTSFLVCFFPFFKNGPRRERTDNLRPSFWQYFCQRRRRQIWCHIRTRRCRVLEQ